ncbi:MAG: hypothetical protein C9356_13935 [Oleiphilus sp.]|nr:MAG: hypothetical protein C9356_13935 [Oleiphilus sp.]
MPKHYFRTTIPLWNLLLITLLISGCASFDKTNILPGQTVSGPGYSFVVPTQQSWFASEYGTGSRIKLMQLNDDATYSILVTMSRGPARGMFSSAEQHLAALKRHIKRQVDPPGYQEHSHREITDTRYGKLCVRYHSSGEDWRGRNRKGPALVKTIGLTCPHPNLENILVNFEMSSRAEVGRQPKNMQQEAEALFSSIQYEALN